MHTMMQEAGATIIGGMIFVALISLYLRVGQSAESQTFKDAVEENSATSADIMEREVRLIGYGVPDTAYILKADSLSITFRADLNNDGKPDTVAYALSPLATNGGSGSIPATRTLTRKQGSASSSTVASGITQFSLDFYDKLGNKTKTAGIIRSITVSMTTISTTDIDSSHPGVYWERTIKPKNMR